VTFEIRVRICRDRSYNNSVLKKKSCAISTSRLEEMSARLEKEVEALRLTNNRIKFNADRMLFQNSKNLVIDGQTFV